MFRLFLIEVKSKQFRGSVDVCDWRRLMPIPNTEGSAWELCSLAKTSEQIWATKVHQMLMYPPTPAVAIAGGGARDSEASAAACSPSLAGSSGADGATTSCPSKSSKARSVPQCHAVSVWTSVRLRAFWLAVEPCSIGVSKRAHGPQTISAALQ